MPGTRAPVSGCARSGLTGGRELSAACQMLTDESRVAVAAPNRPDL